MSSNSLLRTARNKLQRRPEITALEEKLAEQKKRADDQETRANELYNVTQEIQKLIVHLAEKFKTEEQNLYEDVARYSQKEQKFPTSIVHLVDVLVRWYAHQWTLLKTSERWEYELYNEARRLVNIIGRNDTKLMQEYEAKMATDRQEQYEKLKGLMARVQTQFEKLQVLESENSRLQEKQQTANSDRHSSIENLKKEYDNSMIKTRAQDKETFDAQLREALRKQTEAYEKEKRIAKEEYEKSKSKAEDKFELDKLDIQTRLEEKREGELKELREVQLASIKLYISRNAGLEADLDNAKKNVKGKIDAAVAELTKELEDTRVEWKEDMETQRKIFTTHLANFEARKEAENKEQRIELKLKIQELQIRVHELEDSQEAVVADLKEGHKAVLSDLQEAHKATVTKIRDQAELAISQMQEEHAAKELELEERISTLEIDYQSEISTMAAKMVRMGTEYEAAKQQMMNEFEAEKEDLEHQANTEIANLKNEFQKKKAHLEAAAAEATSQLRNDVEAYSAALLARDDFKPMPDNEIRTKFSELADEVKNLGRMDWKADQKVWTTEVLQDLCPANMSIKLFKRHILQEMVWIILHKRILCSPFRPFGHEGAILEDQWETAHGADDNFRNGCYTWPTPEMECERFRYAIVKECRTALKQNIINELDPRAKFKMGFKATMEDIRDDFAGAIGDVIDLTKIPMKIHMKAMDKAAIKAANVWLEFGMQRCRIVVMFPVSSLKPAQERINEARNASIEMILVPELKRYGNAKGFELQTEAFVPGCLGERIRVSAID